MKFKEMAQLSKNEREKKKQDLEMELIKLNTQVATGTPPKNAGSIKRIKKDLAKMEFIHASDEKVQLNKKSQSKTQSQSSINKVKINNKNKDLPKAENREKNNKTE